MKKLIISALLTATALVATPASAQAIIYTDQAAFNAAVGATTLENFNDSTFASGFGAVTTNGAISGNQWADQVGPSTFTSFTFASPVNAFGGIFNLSPGGFGSGIRFTINGASITIGQIGGNAYAGNAFFGFISGTQFTDVRLGGGSGSGVETYRLDDVRFGLATEGGLAVPEPATWLMMILGFGAIGGAMRRRNAKVTETMRFA